MDLQANFNWLIDQPLAFWITAIFLAILGNASTFILKTGYINGVSSYRFGKISIVYDNSLRLMIFAKQDSLDYPHRIFLFRMNFCIMLIIASYIIAAAQLKTGNQNEYITFSVFILSTVAFYKYIVTSFKYAIFKKFYLQCKVIKNIPLTDDGLITFIAKYTNSTNEQVKNVIENRKKRLPTFSRIEKFIQKNDAFDTTGTS